MSSIAQSLIRWQENGQEFQARWYSEAGLCAPKKIAIADDTMKADVAFRLASQGVGLLWRGDYQNARHLLQALARRADRPPREGALKKPSRPQEAFIQHRQAQGKRAAILGSLLIPLDSQYQIQLRRGQEVAKACEQVLGVPGDEGEGLVIPLKGLLALVSAFEWRKKGVQVPVLGAKIYPHFGVFSPVRGEYLDLVMKAPLPQSCNVAFEIGTGSGVLAALLAKKGVNHIVATDLDDRALICAQENLDQLGLGSKVKLQKTDLFPEGFADLIVCNPPWIPAQPSSPIEYAIYDPDSKMLKSFLEGVREHLNLKGEIWLIISDIAEHLGLRTRDELLTWIQNAGLKIVDRLDTKPKHPKSRDRSDPLYEARAKEVTSLWRLQQAG